MSSSDPDIEFASETIFVQTVDPVTKQRIQEPVKGVDCRHLDCFDLQAFLESRSRNRISFPAWKCPLCGGDARPRSLRVSIWMRGVLSKLHTEGSRVQRIAVDRHGAWSPIDDPATRSIETVMLD